MRRETRDEREEGVRRETRDEKLMSRVSCLISGKEKNLTPNSFKTRAGTEKPRERMKAAGTAKGMKAEELLAILLKTGVNGCDVNELSRRFLGAFSGVGELVRCDWKALQMRIKSYNAAHPERKIRGIGEVKCMELAAAFELVRRGYDGVKKDDLPKEITCAEDAEKWFRTQLKLGETQEHFFVLVLDAANKPLSEPICISSGLLNGTPAGAREVFAAAVQWQAAAIIVAHNHPSGDPTPSEGDLALTRELVQAGKVMRIPLLDHLILGQGRFISLHDDGFDFE